MKGVGLRRKELHDGEGKPGAEGRGPDFPGVLPFSTLHQNKSGHEPAGDQDGDKGELAARHGREGDLIDPADSGEGHDGRADGAPGDGGRIGQQVKYGSVEGPEAETHHDSAGDGHRGPEARCPFDDGPEGEGDQEHLQAPVEGNVDDRFLDDLELSGDNRHRVEEHGSQDDPDDPQEAGK